MQYRVTVTDPEGIEVQNDVIENLEPVLREVEAVLQEYERPGLEVNIEVMD